MKMWKRWIAAIGMLCGCGAGAAETPAPVDITRIDRNFATEKIGDLPVCFVNVLDTAPFDLTGFPWRKPGGPLLRLPEELVNEPVNRSVLTEEEPNFFLAEEQQREDDERKTLILHPRKGSED